MNTISKNKRDHTFIIGGTGMLSDAVVDLARTSNAISVLASTETSLKKLGGKLEDLEVAYNPIQIDYCEISQFEKVFRSAVTKHGPIKLLLTWIHDSAPDLSLRTAQLASECSATVDYFNVLSSITAEPGRSLSVVEREIIKIPQIRYHRITLGFVVDGTRSRWLSNKEISQGTVDAIHSCAADYTVGVTSPWEMRP